ncbi:uncharacterized protein [Gossypium hirsutum]|uniref:Uncharacterized protein n=1 Tax=Gossypium hirsutum TaxID=3635 RepID=A0A1U8JRC0_GOSHI|nr:uncharacterized protein LOC107908089 [Gossypium hirsutum]
MGRGQRAPGRGANQIEARQPALIYTVRHREDRDTANVTADTLFIHTAPYFSLIDIGSTHSYIASSTFVNLGMFVESTSREITKISPLDQSVRVNRLYRNVLLEIQRVVFSANLMELSFREFDLILGMDWLMEHRASLDCATKRVILRSENVVEMIMIDEHRDSLSNVIFAFMTEKKLPRLPSNREAEFSIGVLQGTTLVSIAPYHMTPKELRELKA